MLKSIMNHVMLAILSFLMGMWFFSLVLTDDVDAGCDYLKHMKEIYNS